MYMEHYRILEQVENIGSKMLSDILSINSQDTTYITLMKLFNGLCTNLYLR